MRSSLTILSIALLAHTADADFPYRFPREKPDISMSKAMHRLYDDYPGPRPEWNELFTTFKYTPLKGLDYNNADGTISRRDPSKIINANGRYYIWYTKRHTRDSPKGPQSATEDIPGFDWDLAEIWYATSEDGFTWREQKVAVTRPARPNPGWRSVSTPDILEYEGKYFLYYQSFMEIPGVRGDNCPVSASVADSPDGPWKHTNKIVIENGRKGSWDQFAIHDPYPLVHDGKIYLYFKSDYNGRNPRLIRSMGLAIAEQPLGPFEKHSLNPLVSSGHETTLFPFKEGVAALVIRDGNEGNTIQYAEDWVNFDIAAIVSFMPDAAGPYVADAFIDTDYGRGITWGLSHVTEAGTSTTRHSILIRFDCDLSLDCDDQDLKHEVHARTSEEFFSRGMSGKLKSERGQRARKELVEERN